MHSIKTKVKIHLRVNILMPHDERKKSYLGCNLIQNIINTPYNIVILLPILTYIV
jgi:hypothetical protein